MRKLSKFYLMAAAALTMGFASCSSDDSPGSQEPVGKGSTYASLSIAFPKAAGTKALPNDYNENEAWKGRDVIKKITVFLYNETLGTIDYSTFSETSFEGITAEGVLNPKLAVKATPGEQVKAYVVVNDVNDKVTTMLKGKAPADFSTAFADAVAVLASDVAAYNATESKDVILMTNDVAPIAVSIAPSISEEQAKTGDTNLIKVNVQRVVSRAIVTIGDAVTKTIDIADANGVKASTITIVGVKYGVGQSNKSFNILQKISFETPNYTYKPGTVDSSILDNKGLYAFSTVTPIADKTNTNVVSALASETPGKFVLPVTHADANYVKGNTTYFEIQATFTPDKVDGAAYTAGSDVYLGMNDGKFYSTRALATASGQKATHYKGDGTATGGAIAKYVVWLNPDVIPGTAGKLAKMSPTVRNQVYHVHITGFKTIGVPNNPLNPGIPTDPNQPVGPGNPIDPNYPGDPNDPDDPNNPIDPTDPLETQDTYLSVQITVLPYTVHSYEVGLGTDY